MSTLKRITILTFICFFSVFLFACGNQESPTASISNVVVDNGEITIEVEYKDPSSIAT